MSRSVAYARTASSRRALRRLSSILLPLAFGVSLSAAAHAEPPRAAPPVRYAAAQGANWGGGFFEFLASGGSSSSRRAYAPGDADAEGRAYASDPRYARQIVAYTGSEKPGTVIIDTPQRLLYLVEPGGKALRYGIGVGRPGFTWAGVKSVSMKREWPDWTPPEEMLKRKPDLPVHMAGGPDNPLGARALYLGSSLYRIHGSNEPWTIGTQVSSGCIRMRNEDVIDLYERVPVGARVVVM
jgi:lipoprotein-anchoring transpeptidase ErfK/SrfK